MKRIKLVLLLTVITGLAFQSCSRFDNNDDDDTNNDKPLMENLIIDQNFDWETSKEVTFKITAKDNRNTPLENVKITAYTDDPENGGEFIFSGVTSANGLFTREYEIPSYYDSITITNNYIGIPNMARIAVEGNYIDHSFGGTNNKYIRIPLKNSQNINYDFNYLGTYDGNGVPDYLEPENDEISQDLLDDINNTLPEQIELPDSHPEYLDPDNSYDLSLIDPCEVWVTFVHEGAGYKNTLGFYTYQNDNPPESIDDIEEITIIFPNVSYEGSGGGLVSGNKVKLGTFPGNSSIGWVLFPNAWTGEVTNTYYKYFSNPDFNPESTPELRQHTVLLNDVSRELILLGVEDIKREGGWCDHDFNDAIFYVTANPIQAVDFSNLPLIDYTGEDEDGDGITNNNDDYPDDPNRAFDNYFFTQGTWGTLAFEDMWPGTGDYDFNDMVIDYNFNQVTNAENKVVEIYGEFILKAFGASFHNGFGIDLGINLDMVNSVSGYKIQENWPDINGKGLENGQSTAVIIVFDDTYNLMQHTGGIGVNTNPAYPYVTPDTTRIKISLNEPADLEDIGVPPYNPFVIVDQVRSHEIHLPDHAPTSLANTELLGTERDDSNPETGRYYKTENHLPFGIKLIEQFKYPVEKTEVLQAYLKFRQWAESSGTLFTDWYVDQEGYRNENLIYQIPEE